MPSRKSYGESLLLVLVEEKEKGQIGKFSIYLGKNAKNAIFENFLWGRPVIQAYCRGMVNSRIQTLSF